MAAHKLVRDKVPEMIKEEGHTPIIKRLAGEPLEVELLKKLEEEKKEYLEAEVGAEKAEELADMLEVIFGLSEMRGFSAEELLGLAKKKRDEWGGLSEGLYWEGNE